MYADEVLRRFKLDLVDEHDTLESASIDRVRACFRAHVRSLELTDDDAEYPWVGSTHKHVFFVSNAEKIQMLANLIFREDGHKMAEFCDWFDCGVPAIDIAWSDQRLHVATIVELEILISLVLPGRTCYSEASVSKRTRNSVAQHTKRHLNLVASRLQSQVES